MARTRRDAFSRRERQIMDSLFRRREATVAEVLKDMRDPPSYSAVRATLRILEEKVHVRHRDDGQRYVYLPVQSRENAKRAALDHVVRTFFDGSVDAAVVALLGMGDTRVPDERLTKLAEQILEAKNEGR
jgi:predicted transcriptional regulator